MTPKAYRAPIRRLGASVLGLAPARAHSLVLVALATALVAAGAGSAATATLPTLYVDYGANCTFQLGVDSPAGEVPVATGSVLPPGNYQVLTESSVLYTSLSNPPCMPQFRFTGPGVNLSIGYTSFGASVPIALAPSSSYVASDAYASTVSTTLTISATGSSSSLVPTQTSTLPSTSTTSSEDPVGSALGTSHVAYRGTLAAAVAADGKLELRFRGKAVNSLSAGRYTIMVSDQAAASALVLRKAAQIILSGASFTRRRSVSLTLTAGRYSYPAHPNGAKTFFVVHSS